MNEEFPKEIYQKACEHLTPSSGSLREVYAVKKTEEISEIQEESICCHGGFCGTDLLSVCGSSGGF